MYVYIYIYTHRHTHIASARTAYIHTYIHAYIYSCMYEQREGVWRNGHNLDAVRSATALAAHIHMH
jgi:hypothetical protein